jgi:hypothetical protein
MRRSWLECAMQRGKTDFPGRAGYAQDEEPS